MFIAELQEKMEKRIKLIFGGPPQEASKCSSDVDTGISRFCSAIAILAGK